MVEINSIYKYGQDGEIVSEEIIQLFNLSERDVIYDKRRNVYKFDFVGFVFKGENILSVFPKHYYSSEEINALDKKMTNKNDDIKLLFSVIQKYSNNQTSTAKAEHFIGSRNSFESDYPFYHFYRIYDYYRKYGLYKEISEVIKEGFQGKISWKNTIRKADVVVSSDSIIFVPLYTKKSNMLIGFITDCMAFVIDYTVSQFSDFISLKGTQHSQKYFDYFSNIDYVVKKLNEINRDIRKDLDKLLVENLIEFFIQYKSKGMGGNIHVKINYFDMIWQTGINTYLNSYFDSFDKDKNSIIFDLNRVESAVKFGPKQYTIDVSKNKFKVNLDHFSIDGNVLYIFDSKYYYDLNELNYKQYSYNEFLRYLFPEVNEIISVLILPGDEVSRKHFELDDSLKGDRIFGNEIYEQYINVKNILISYIEN